MGACVSLISALSAAALILPQASFTIHFITVIIACRLVLYLNHAYHQQKMVGDSRIGTGVSSMGVWHSSPPEQIDLRPLT